MVGQGTLAVGGPDEPLAIRTAGDEDAAKWGARCNKAATAAREMLDVGWIFEA